MYLMLWFLAVCFNVLYIEEIKMASIQKRTSANGGISYRVQVRLKGHPTETASFERLTDAKRWAQSTESAIREGRHFKTSQAKKYTMGEAIDRYFKDVLAHRDNPVNQITYLNWWKQAIGDYSLADVTPALIVEHNRSSSTKTRWLYSHINHGSTCYSA